MKIKVVPYKKDWKEAFEKLRENIYPVVSDHILSIEHVGSTSVEGLAAKPIIDMDIIIEGPQKLPAIISALQSLGYNHLGDLGIEGREAFRHPAPEIPHHLYVCLDGCASLRNHLVVRDHLRTHPEDRDQYSRLKLKLASLHSEDIDSYLDGKTDFILSILKKYDFDSSQLTNIEKANRK